MKTTVLAVVVDAEVDPEARDDLRRWLVGLRIEKVLSGEVPRERSEISVLVHSPSRDFVTPDPVGKTFIVTFLDPVRDPYTGGLEIAPAR